MKHLFLSAALFAATLFTTTCFGQYGWIKTFGDQYQDLGYTSTTDNSGNLIVAGVFQGDVDFGNGQTGFTASSTSTNPYIIKYDTTGTIQWLRTWNVAESAYIYSVCSDGTNTYVYGFAAGQIDLDPGAGQQLTDMNTSVTFILKLDQNANLVWAKPIQCPDAAITFRFIKRSSNGRLKICGHFNGTFDADPSAGTTTLTSNSGNSLFFIDMDSDGNFGWAKQLNGQTIASTDITGITTNAAGNFYLTGYFSEPIDFDPGAGNTNTTASYIDLFLLNLDNDGNFVWVKTLPFATGNAVELDNSENIILAGTFSDVADFDFGTGTQSYTTTDAKDGFILKMNGNADFIWVNVFTGADDQVPKAISIDQNNVIHTAGRFIADFLINHNSYTFASNSPNQNEVFYTTMDSNGNFTNTILQLGSGISTVFSIQCTPFGQEYLVGHYNGQADLNMNPEVTSFTSNGASAYDAYVIRLGELNYASVNENMEQQLSVYPNPATNVIRFTIDHPEKYQVLDAMGKVQLTGTTTGEIELESLAAGMYVLELAEGGKVRFVKD